MLRNHFHSASRRLLLGVLLISVFSGRVLAKAPQPAFVTQQIASEQIEQWVTQLDDDRFDTRQRAQRQLKQAGQPALIAVAEAARTGSLESATRAINILLSWSEDPQQKFRLAALEELINLPNRPRESAMATRLLAEAREQLAVAEINRLGGKVTQLGGYNNLEIVIDKNWKGGDEGMKHLAEVQHAVKISLRVAPITEPALEHLVNLPQLRVLEIHGKTVSDETLKKVQQQLPNAIIDPRDGAMLGILGNANDPNKSSVAVSDVVQNGAAHKAGIMPGDRITELNGEKLTDFTALTERIAKYRPGDTAELTILRKNKPQTVKVTFDLWGATDNTKLIGQKQRNIRRLPMQGLPIQVPPR